MRTLIYSVLFVCALFCISATRAVTTKNRVTNIPGYTGPAIESYNGYLFVKPENDGHLFYWFTPAKTNTGREPLVLWLNGGPGCTSMVGFFIEHGPFQLYEAGKLRENPTAWYNYANVLYIDQPLGVGLSYPYQDNPFIPTSSTQAAFDITTGLLEFFKQFPEYANREFYVAGESYAGKYIPYFYNYYLNQNRIKLNIRGLLLGNAMIKPSVQYISYPNHGYSSAIFTYKQRVDSVNQFVSCLAALRTGDIVQIELGNCSPLFLNMIHNGGRLSPFDVRQLIAATHAENIIIDYLKDPAVMAALGISTKSVFHKCYSLIHSKFINEFHADVPDSVILRMFNTTNVLLYSGQFDLRVSGYGTSEMLRRLNWSGREQFNSQSPTIFRSENVMDEAWGQFKTVGGVTHATIYGGSHMTPVTVPGATLELFRRFIVQRNNLCPPNNLNCNPAPVCPNACSGANGNCNNGQCNCRPNFSGPDCSIAMFPVGEELQNMQNQGYIHGRDIAIFQYKFTPSVSLVNVDVTLSRGASGLPYVFVNVSSEGANNNPSAESIKAMLREIGEYNLFGNSFEKQGFAAFNTSHDAFKALRLRDQPVYRGLESVLYVAVYNANDYPVSFNLTVSIQPSVGGANWMFITLAGSVILAVIVAMEVSIVVQQYNKRQQLLKSNNYRQILLDDDDGHLSVNRGAAQQQPLIR